MLADLAPDAFPGTLRQGGAVSRRGCGNTKLVDVTQHAQHEYLRPGLWTGTDETKSDASGRSQQISGDGADGAGPERPERAAVHDSQKPAVPRVHDDDLRGIGDRVIAAVSVPIAGPAAGRDQQPTGPQIRAEARRCGQFTAGVCSDGLTDGCQDFGRWN